MRVVNVVVKAILGSPLHRLLSRSLLILSYEGRRTGRRRALPVMYARDGERIVVVAGHHERKSWWRNFGAVPRPVWVTVRGALQHLPAVRPAPASDEYASALEAYRRRYPKARFDAGVPVVTIGPPPRSDGREASPRGPSPSDRSAS